MGLELALFGLLALIAVVSAAAMIFQENAVHSALFLILNFGCVALLFLMLDAPFIAMVQIAVYAGAIMVLFLFVIMLLGAEQTSDTGTETLKWLPAAATILGVSLLVSLATPLLISGGLALPDAPGEDPQVRLVHAANAADPVTITIGENEPIDGVRFGDTTNFFGLDAGDYPVTIADADGEVIYEDTVVLEADSVFTIVAYGDDLAHDLQIMVAEDAVAPLNFTFDEILDEDAEEDAEPARVVVEDLALEELFSVADVGSGDWELTVRGSDRVIVFSETLTLEGGEVFTAVEEGDQLIELAGVPNVLSVQAEDVASFNVLNIAVDAPVSLVDLGSDRELDVADGEITDAVLATDIGYAELAAAFTLPDRRYNLRFVQEINGDFEIIGLSGQMLDVEEGTERTLILTPDFESTANAEGNYRSQVFDSELNIQDPFGSPGDIGGLLFIDYLLPVNLVGFLLLVALVGVIVLTRPEGIQSKRRSTVNRRRKVSRPLVSVISQQTGSDVVVDTPKLDAPEPSDDDA